MKDKFDEVMEKFLVPMEKFAGPVMDSTYFLRRDGSFVFAEGYCHPRGAFWGMIIKYPLPGGHLNIFGRQYGWTHREHVDGELRIVPYARQLENQFKVAPELKALQGDKPPFARDFVRFPLSDFQGYFDHRRSLRLHREALPWMDQAVRATAGLLKVEEGNLGVSGSLSYGRVEDDIDLVFSGTPEENRAIVGRIRAYIRENPSARVVELGKEWPLRFYYADTLICPFFLYAEESRIPLRQCEMIVREPSVRFSATVSNDLHGFYLPAILSLTGIRREGGKDLPDLDLIVYHGALRGELFRGDQVRGEADLIEVTTPEGSRPALLVVGIDQIHKAG